jgi:hypothetical protein
MIGEIKFLDAMLNTDYLYLKGKNEENNYCYAGCQ